MKSLDISGEKYGRLTAIRRAQTLGRHTQWLFLCDCGTEKEIKTYVYDNVNLPFLRFYYRHVHVGRRIEKVPMIVPDYQMESLKIICAADADNTIVSLVEVPKFEKGQLVKVIDGVFKGVVGIVARWQGQQRVGVVVDDLVTMATAYIPSAFLQKI